MVINDGYHNAYNSNPVSSRYPLVHQIKTPTHPYQGSIIHVFVGHMGATTSVAFFSESQLLCFEKAFFLRLRAAV